MWLADVLMVWVVSEVCGEQATCVAREIRDGALVIARET